jgi:uncharacterized protein
VGLPFIVLACHAIGMDLILTWWPLILGLSVTGMISGVFAGLLGVGGGSIIVPALAIAFAALGIGDDVAQHVAVASSLAIIIPTGIRSAMSHHKRGAVDISILRLWAPFVFAGCLVGGLMAGWFSGDALRIAFGVLAFIIALNIVTLF